MSKNENEQEEFETIISFTYSAKDPIDAAQQFFDNLKHSNWFIQVKNIKTGEEFMIDSEKWTIEY